VIAKGASMLLQFLCRYVSDIEMVYMGYKGGEAVGSGIL
jgi:hypothetical protein